MSNYDPNEIAKFDASAAQWWDTDGAYRTLHAINPLRLAFIDKAVSLAGKKVVDVGCGGGILSEALAKAGALITGIDLSAALINTAQAHLATSQLSIDYRHDSAENLAHAQPGAFDIVTCLEMLEHVPNPRAIVQACATLVKPGGDVFFSTINRHPWAYLSAILAAEYVLQLLPRGTHDYAKFIRPSVLDAWASDNNLTLIALRGMSYNPFNQRYFLSDDVRVNYLVHCKKTS